VSVRQIKQKLAAVVAEFGDCDPYELRRIFAEVIREREMEIGWSEEAKRKTWTDDELRVILSDAPTKENCVKHARGFQRGYGSIEQIYRWAATSDEEIKKKRANDTFIEQIKRVAKQLGWRA
jgi:hypothetical protein